MFFNSSTNGVIHAGCPNKCANDLPYSPSFRIPVRILLSIPLFLSVCKCREGVKSPCTIMYISKLTILLGGRMQISHLGALPPRVPCMCVPGVMTSKRLTRYNRDCPITALCLSTFVFISPAPSLNVDARCWIL